MDSFSRYAIRVSVAQICQTVGWSKVHTTPFEVLSDVLEEYILSIGRLANNYATLMGQSEPNLSHVSLAFNDMGISYNELKEYTTYFESGCVLDVPKYPIHKESHLNHLKPGSKEVLTRPPHVHEHLPPMYPHLEDEELPAVKSPMHEEAVDRNSLSPVPRIKFEPLNESQWDELPDEELQPFRELSSVLMTTSGYLSSAREGKLPEVRSLVPPEPVEVYDTLKPSDGQNAKDKENRTKKRPSDDKNESERKSKHRKHKRSSRHREKSSKIHSRKTNEVVSSPVPKVNSLNNGLKLNDTACVSESELLFPKEHTFELMDLQSPISNETLNSVGISDIDLPLCNKDNKQIPSDDDSIEVLGLFSGNQDCNNGAFIEIGSSPLNNMDYSNPPSPGIDIIERYKPSPIVQCDIECPTIDLDSPIPVVTVDSSSGEGKKSVDRYMKEKTPPSENILRISSPPTQNRNGTPVIDLLDSPRHKSYETHSTIKHVRPNSEKEPCRLDSNFRPEEKTSTFNLFGESHALKAESHSHIKKKKKKDKKSTEKDKDRSEIMFREQTNDTEYRFKSMKKKKRDHKKGKKEHSSLVQETDPTLLPSKKVRLENPLEQNGSKSKDELLCGRAASKTLDPLPWAQENKANTSHTEPKTIKTHKKSGGEVKKKDKKKDKEAMKHLSENLFSFEPLKRVTTNIEKPMPTIPKITLKLGPSPPKTKSPSKPQKISIKLIPKRDVSEGMPASSGGYSSQPSTSSHVQDRHCSNSSHSEHPAPAQISEFAGEPNQIWICPACNLPDDGSPMIACDSCDLWFHWICVGIREALEGDWFCKACLAKREQDRVREKKKKHKKRKQTEA